MGINVMRANSQIVDENIKKISDSSRENNAAEWFASACASAITDDPVLGATFGSYYGAEFGNQVSDISRELDT